MNGGLSGCFPFPDIFLRPHSDHCTLSQLDSKSGSGQPWAICHALTPERYFPIVSIEMGSKGHSMLSDRLNSLGSITAQIAKECRSSKEAGRWMLSGIEKVSQER